MPHAVWCKCPCVNGDWDKWHSEWHSPVQSMFYYGSAQTKATECQLWEFLCIRKVVKVLISGHAHAHGLHVKVLLRKQRLVIST